MLFCALILSRLWASTPATDRSSLIFDVHLNLAGGCCTRAQRRSRARSSCSSSRLHGSRRSQVGRLCNAVRCGSVCSVQQCGALYGNSGALHHNVVHCVATLCVALKSAETHCSAYGAALQHSTLGCNSGVCAVSDVFSFCAWMYTCTHSRSDSHTAPTSHRRTHAFMPRYAYSRGQQVHSRCRVRRVQASVHIRRHRVPRVRGRGRGGVVLAHADIPRRARRVPRDLPRRR